MPTDPDVDVWPPVVLEVVWALSPECFIILITSAGNFTSVELTTCTCPVTGTADTMDPEIVVEPGTIVDVETPTSPEVVDTETPTPSEVGDAETPTPPEVVDAPEICEVVEAAGPPFPAACRRVVKEEFLVVARAAGLNGMYMMEKGGLPRGHPERNLQ